MTEMCSPSDNPDSLTLEVILNVTLIMSQYSRKCKRKEDKDTGLFCRHIDCILYCIMIFQELVHWSLHNIALQALLWQYNKF